MSALDIRPVEQTMRLRGRFIAVLGVSAVAALSATVVFLDIMGSDRVIANGFERAFASTNRLAVVELGKPFDGISGSEDFWLRAQTNLSVKSVAVGNEITLSGNGLKRTLTVTDVHEAGDAETHITTDAHRVPALLLTCREGDATSGRNIQLRFEGGRIREISTDLMPRAL
jgi:hypothetical protein